MTTKYDTVHDVLNHNNLVISISIQTEETPRAAWTIGQALRKKISSFEAQLIFKKITSHPTILHTTAIKYGMFHSSLDKHH